MGKWPLYRSTQEEMIFFSSCLDLLLEAMGLSLSLQKLSPRRGLFFQVEAMNFEPWPRFRSAAFSEVESTSLKDLA